MNSLESTFHSATYPQPLRVRGSSCANPECECREVFLELLDHADGGRAGDGPPVLESSVPRQLAGRRGRFSGRGERPRPSFWTTWLGGTGRSRILLSAALRPPGSCHAENNSR